MLANIEEDSNGELVLVFPEEILEELDWDIGDTLKWTLDGDKWILTKDENSNTK